MPEFLKNIRFEVNKEMLDKSLQGLTAGQANNFLVQVFMDISKAAKDMGTLDVAELEKLFEEYKAKMFTPDKQAIAANMSEAKKNSCTRKFAEDKVLSIDENRRVIVW